MVGKSMRGYQRRIGKSSFPFRSLFALLFTYSLADGKLLRERRRRASFTINRNHEEDIPYCTTIGRSDAMIDTSLALASHSVSDVVL